MSEDWALERTTVLNTYYDLLEKVTGDGSKKRQTGSKPPWWRDNSHEAAIFSHLNKWKHGEQVDKDSGAHPLVHLAWRALAIAYQETYGLVDPVAGVVSDSDSTGYKEDVADPIRNSVHVGGVRRMVHTTIRPEGLERETHPRQARWDSDYVASRGTGFLSGFED